MTADGIDGLYVFCQFEFERVVPLNSVLKHGCLNAIIQEGNPLFMVTGQDYRVNEVPTMSLVLYNKPLQIFDLDLTRLIWEHRGFVDPLVIGSGYVENEHVIEKRSWRLTARDINGKPWDVYYLGNLDTNKSVVYLDGPRPHTELFGCSCYQKWFYGGKV